MLDYQKESRNMGITSINEGMSPKLTNIENENEFKDIVKALEKEGVKISSVEPAKKSKRNKALGAVTRDVIFYFTDGQKATISYKFGNGRGVGKKVNGQIYSVKVNSKIIPITAAGDMDVKPARILSKIARLVTQNSVKFQKNLAKKQAKAETKTAENGEKKRVTQANRIKNLETAIDDAKKENNDLSVKKTELDTAVKDLEVKNKLLKQGLEA